MPVTDYFLSITYGDYNIYNISNFILLKNEGENRIKVA